MSKQPAILIVSSEFPPGPGGIGNHASNLGVYLRNNGYTVHVLTELRTSFRKELEESERNWITYVPDSAPLRKFQLMIQLIRLLRSKEPETVIVSGMFPIQLVGLFLVFWSGRAVAILHGHELLMGGRLKRWWLKKSLNKFSSGIAVSEFSKQNAAPFIDGTRIKVIPNGIDVNRFQVKRSPKPHQNKSIHLLTVGRISPRKGQLNMIEALPAILREYPETVYHMVGLPDFVEPVMKRAKQLDVVDHIRVHGAVSSQELNAILNQTDIFMMLSENQPNGDVEGFGIAILEANNFGVPAIGSTGCGIEQAIQDGRTGILVDAKSGTQITEAVKRIIDHYESFANQAVTWAKRHSWGEIGKQYEGQIKSLKENFG